MRPGTDSVSRYRAAFAERDLVQELEALAARALPPLTLLDLDGWRLRSAGGLSWRANSAWPRAEGPRLALPERLRQTEAFYAQGGLDPAVQVGPGARPAGLEAVLARRGYRRAAVVEARTRRLDLLTDLAEGDGGVALLPLDDWLPRWAAATAAPPAHERMAARMLERAAPPAAYVALVRRRDVAVARGVLDGGWLGIDLLGATGPLRTPAVGAALLAALGRWGVARGGVRAWTAVDGDDPAATALTAGAGFRRAYASHYLVLPQALVRR